ncbi:hypothetical protein [Aliiroseovarius sp. PrR006]|uniref:hypothetical protein n=1 Tax=Aliiroseovarius sp. PrR006 TaxID=2706883 RepID=UPI0013D82CE9|nr:hypothetical protein [Aliiroseovarius sp. PrR006]NDW53518.1 hypothetical protein [Aliiroseovarius sp. PrR006]
MEFTVPSPLGAHATLMAQRPTRPAPDPTRVEKSPTAGETRADPHNTQEHGNTQSLIRTETRDMLAPPPDPDQPVGPPPTFQMNVLEMERELHQRLAQIELERSLSEDRASTSVQVAEEDKAPGAPEIPSVEPPTQSDDPVSTETPQNS